MASFIALMYHALGPNERAIYTVDFSAFERQVERLRSEGFTIEGFDGLEARLDTGQWPERYVVMTFDDGHRSNLKAAEILRNAGGGATFFLTKDLCQSRPDYLDDAQIRELAAICHVGSHAVSHTPLAKQPTAQVKAELSESKRWLEEVVGEEIRTFSAPYGSISRRVSRLARSCGYTLVGNSREWWNEPRELKAKRVVNRVAIRRSFSMETFARIVRRNPRYFIGRRVRSGLLAGPKAVLSQQQLRWVTRKLRG